MFWKQWHGFFYFFLLGFWEIVFMRLDMSWMKIESVDWHNLIMVLAERDWSFTYFVSLLIFFYGKNSTGIGVSDYKKMKTISVILRILRIFSLFPVSFFFKYLERKPIIKKLTLSFSPNFKFTICQCSIDLNKSEF